MGQNLKPDEHSIVNAAVGMLLLYGENAVAFANSQALKFAKRNDREGEDNWRDIAKAILKQQLQPQPHAGLSLKRL